MKKHIFFIPALILFAVSCEKEENSPSQTENEPVSEVKMITEVVSGGRGEVTKATIGNTTPTFAWTAGDNVAVHVSNGDSHEYVITSKGADAAASSAKFEVTYGEGYSRDAFAVYPSTIVSASAANFGQSGHTLDVTLPGSYTLAQVSGETSPCPMISTNAPNTDWDFYQLCGLLRLTVNSIPPSTKRLEIDFHGKKVWGDFSIANPNPGSSSIATTDDDAHDVITITNSGNTFYSGWGDGKVFNIPLPAGAYSQITVTAYNADGDAVLTMTRPFAYTASNEYGTKRTASFPVFSINTSRSKRVIFAPGNLQASTSDGGDHWTWGFAKHQYDFIGSGGANTKINGKGSINVETGTVDLFGWSCSISAYGIHNSTRYSPAADNDYFGDFVDWGIISTFDGTTYENNYWRTLSSKESDGYEWWDMLRNRPNTAVNGVNNARYALATINTDGTPVKGMIIFPDYYMGPTTSSTDITWGDLINNFNTYDWANTTCTVDGWKILDSAGCVFLPAAGYREGSTYKENEHRYASSTPGSEYEGNVAGWGNLRFGCTPYSVYWGIVSKYYGASVRLVHEVQ
jgi:hypothetical protein